MAKKLFVCILVAGAALLAFTLTRPVYALQGFGNGEVYWNNDEALVYLTDDVLGAHMSLFRYAAEPFFLNLGQARTRDDLACARTVVIRITGNDLQVLDPGLPTYFRHGCEIGMRYFSGHFYAASWPKLWVWDGTRFERPTPEQYGAYATAFDARSLPPGPDAEITGKFDNIDGWSWRSFTKGQRYDLTVNGQPMTLIFTGLPSPNTPQPPYSLDLIRPGQSPQRIWYFDGRPHRVTKTEYYAAFPQGYDE
jgi:hypothetical protein